MCPDANNAGRTKAHENIGLLALLTTMALAVISSCCATRYGVAATLSCANAK